jgi:methionine synthase II (cobalamin-independent)
MNAGYFLIQLASEQDKEKVYKEIGQTIRKDAKGVKQVYLVLSPFNGDKLKKIFPSFKVAFIGVINPLNPTIETPEQVSEALQTAAKYIPVDQLGATDDCGTFSYAFRMVCLSNISYPSIARFLPFLY